MLLAGPWGDQKLNILSGAGKRDSPTSQVLVISQHFLMKPGHKRVEIEMLSEEIPAVPATLWRHLRCQEEGPKHNTENAALEYLDYSPVCTTVLLSDIIYLFIIFVTVAANC